jgi:hypothetical protein
MTKVIHVRHTNRMQILRPFLGALLLLVPALAQDHADPADARTDFTGHILNLFGPANPAPLTERERLHLFVLNTIGPVPLLGESVSAAIEQGLNTPREWGQGGAGFTRRVTANLAYNAVRQTITYAAGRALGEDTRYFAATETGVWPRTRHALISTFTARRVDGGETFSVAGTMGVVGAATISSIWGPDSWKRPGNIAKNAGMSFGFSAAFNVVREFLPSVLRRKVVGSRSTD